MSKFLQTLFSTPVKASLTAWLGAIVGIVVLQFAGSSGEVRLPAKTATELLLLTGALIFSISAVAYSYWKKCQPSEKIEAARKQGRPICGCTADGVIMLLDAKRSDRRPLYVCPLCKWEELAK